MSLRTQYPFPSRRHFLLAAFTAATLGCALSPTHAADSGFAIEELTDRVRIRLDGAIYTEYRFRHDPHVYFYPLNGPGGVPMTRDYPMKEIAGEERDHVHHRSLWFSHGSVNGIDFWAETPAAGKIVHVDVLEKKTSSRGALLRTAHKWVAPDNRVILTDETTVTFHARKDGNRMFDFEVTLIAPATNDVVFGDTKEGTMGIRLAETMRLKQNRSNASHPPGRIVQSTGTLNADTWGKRAAWCDYSGLINGELYGVAIFDHPENPRHPTWWHVRDYGLFAANPFGVHDFERLAPNTGNLTLPAGRNLKFKYRFYLHRGDEQTASVAKEYDEFIKTKRN